MQIKYRLSHPNAKEPYKKHSQDACFDLYATEANTGSEWVEYRTGVHFEIPTGMVGLVYPRSSISNTCFSMANSVGVIDSGYIGEITVRMRKVSDQMPYTVGERIAQIMFQYIPDIELIHVLELEETDRGSSGYGSTGLK